MMSEERKKRIEEYRKELNRYAELEEEAKKGRNTYIAFRMRSIKEALKNQLWLLESPAR
jgi:hypothetical protein